MTRAVRSCFALLITSITLGAQAEETLHPNVVRQLALIYAEKESRTPAQAKLETGLVYAVRTAKGDLAMRDLPTLPRLLPKAGDGRLKVEVRAALSDGLRAAITELGGAIDGEFPAAGALLARLPLSALEPLAEREDVEGIRPVVPPVTRGARAKTFPRPKTGAINSQGDHAHGADLARNLFGVEGTGVRVGVISDSVESLPALQGAGELPAVTVLPGRAGQGDSEGTAMLEIIHDLAPGAELFFAASGDSPLEMAASILALREAGCDVIVDDIGFPGGEAVFQDDGLALAATTVVLDGAVYFSAAGNDGNLDSDHSAVWEGDFRPSVPINIPGQTAGISHSFGPTNQNRLTGSTRSIFLQWSDPWSHSSNDYDLCLMTADGGSVVGCSTNIQDGNDLPVELMFPASAGINTTGLRLLVVNVQGHAAPRYLHLNATDSKLQLATTGQIYGHATAPGAIAVAAVDAATAGGGRFVGGGANPTRDYSSDGPRRIFYLPDGTPVTPGNLLASGGILRQKPDLAAADGVSTATPDFENFPGTSAAAPHAAAIAALVLEMFPEANPLQVLDVLASTALDIMAPGVDRTAGFGLIDAASAVELASFGGSFCLPDEHTLCIDDQPGDGRFRIQMSFRTANGGGLAGLGGATPLATLGVTQGGLFSFFSPENPEVLVKVLNACGLNQRYWVFFAATTNVEFALTVTDTVTGFSETYLNRDGVAALPVQDTGALPCL